MNTLELNDDISDLLGSPMRTTPIVPPPSYQPPSFTERCPKCRGSGRFTSYSGRSLGQCFTCKGSGKQTFKTSMDQRAANRAKAEAKKARNAQENWDQFTELNSTVAAWIVASPDFAFAASMGEAVRKWGDLTPNQLAACQRCIAKSEARQTERAERIANAPVLDATGIDKLKQAFDHAVAFSAEKGLKLSPRITVGGMTIKPAKATSANPGALYVTGLVQDKSENVYLGKIKDGKFFGSFACTPEQEQKVLAFVADPAKAAKVYGQTTGTCCICNATLISKWKHRGIGPICAQKFGW